MTVPNVNLLATPKFIHPFVNVNVPETFTFDQFQLIKGEVAELLKVKPPIRFEIKEPVPSKVCAADPITTNREPVFDKSTDPLFVKLPNIFKVLPVVPLKTLKIPVALIFGSSV